MSLNVVFMPQAPGSWLMNVEVWRDPSGETYGHLVDMPPVVIDAIPGEPHDKMLVIADLFEQAAAWMRVQAEALRPIVQSTTLGEAS